MKLAAHRQSLKDRDVRPDFDKSSELSTVSESAVSEHRNKCAKLADLLGTGGFACLAHSVRALYPTAGSLRARLLAPDVEKQMRRLRVRQVLSEEEFRFLYPAVGPLEGLGGEDRENSRVPSSLEHEREKDVFQFLYSTLIEGELEGGAHEAIIGDTGLTLSDLLSVLTILLKFACDLAPPDGRSWYSHAERHTPAQTNGAVEMNDEGASGSLSSLILQFESYREWLHKHLESVASGLTAPSTKFEKHYWQNLVLHFREFVSVLSGIGEPSALRASNRRHSMASGVRTEHELLLNQLNRLIRNTKHAELSEDEQATALEFFREWHARGRQVYEALHEFARANEQRASELPVLRKSLYSEKILEKSKSAVDEKPQVSLNELRSATVSWNDIKNGMDLEKRTAISKHYTELVTSVKPDMLIDQLVKRRVLSIRDSSLVFSSPFSDHQMHVLLDILVRKEGNAESGVDSDHPDAFEELLGAIATRYSILASKIRADFDNLSAEASDVQKSMTSKPEDHLSTYRQILKLYYEHEVIPGLTSRPFLGFGNDDTRISDYFIPPMFTTIDGEAASPLEIFARPCVIHQGGDSRSSTDKSSDASGGAEQGTALARIPRFVLVEGESGAGKSSLAMHLLQTWCRDSSCFRRQRIEFLLHIDIRLLLLSMEATEAALRGLSGEGGLTEDQQGVGVRGNGGEANGEDAGAGKRRRSRRQMEEEVQAAAARFDVKNLLAELMLQALHIAGLRSERFSKIKLTKRDVWDLFEEHQHRILILIDNFEPLISSHTSPANSMMDSAFYPVTNVLGAIENLVFGSVLPEAKVLVFSSPQFSSAFQDQFEAKYLLLGLPNTAATRLTFIRQYCRLNHSPLEHFRVLMRVLELLGPGGGKDAKEGGGKDKKKGMGDHLLPAIRGADGHQRLNTKARNDSDEIEELLESLRATRRSPRQRALAYATQAVMQTLTRIPLYFSMLLTSIDLSERLEALTGARIINISQYIGNLITVFGTTSAALVNVYLLDQVLSMLKNYISQTTEVQYRNLMTKALSTLQEKSFHQLGSYNIIFGRQAAPLIAAQQRELLKKSSMALKVPLADGSMGGSSMLGMGSLGLGRARGISSGMFSSGSKDGEAGSERNTADRAGTSTFASGTSVSENDLLHEVIKKSGLALLEGTEALARAHSTKMGKCRITYFYFRNRLYQEYFACKHLDGIVTNELGIVARQQNEDPKKYFVSLLQNRSLHQLNILFAASKLIHQGSLQTTAAETNPWLRCYLESFMAYNKYLISCYIVNKMPLKQYSSSPIGSDYSPAPEEGPNASPLHGSSVAALAAQAGANADQIWTKKKRPPVPSISVIQLNLFFEMLNLITNSAISGWAPTLLGSVGPSGPAQGDPSISEMIANNALTTMGYLETAVFKACLDQLPAQFSMRAGFRDGSHENERLFLRLSKDLDLNAWTSSMPLPNAMSGLSIALESRFCHVTELVLQLNAYTRATSEHLYYRLAEAIRTVSQAQYLVQAEAQAIIAQQLSAAVIAQKGKASIPNPPTTPSAQVTPPQPGLLHLNSLKLYWNSIEFLCKFLWICFPPPSTEEAPTPSKAAGGPKRLARKESKRPQVRKSTITRLKCIYERSRPTKPTMTDEDLSSSRTQMTLGTEDTTATQNGTAPGHSNEGGKEGAGGDEGDMHSKVSASSGWVTQLRAALDHLSSSQQLHEFSWRNCRQLRIMSTVTKYLPVTERLERLSLAGSAMQVFQSQDVVNAVADSKSVRVLKLAYMKIDTISFNSLVQLLKLNKSITEFDLRGIQHVEKQVNQLIENMKLNSKLEFLNLQGIQFSAIACEQLAQLCKINKSLRLLSVSNPMLDIAGIRPLQDAAHALTNSGRRFHIDGV